MVRPISKSVLSRKQQIIQAENASLKLEQDKDKTSNIRFTINGTDIHQWFRQKQQEFLLFTGIKLQERQESRGIKL